MTLNPQHVVIDSETVQQYGADGVVVLRQFFTPEYLATLGAAIDRALTTPANYFHYRNMWHNDRAFEAICRDSPAPLIAAQLMQSDTVSLLFDQVFVKEAASNAATGWHNDQPYWPVKGDDLMSLWIALDRVDIHNGAVEFIEGSHLWRRWFTPFYADERGGFGHYKTEDGHESDPIPDFEAERDQHRIVSFDLEPGDALAFNGLIVHGAARNTVARRRRAYSIRYVGRDACYWPRPTSADFLIDETMQPGDRFATNRFPVVYTRD